MTAPVASLLPCPFCGGTIHTYQQTSKVPDNWAVRCGVCGGQCGPSASSVAARYNWNLRALTPAGEGGLPNPELLKAARNIVDECERKRVSEADDYDPYLHELVDFAIRRLATTAGVQGEENCNCSSGRGAEHCIVHAPNRIEPPGSAVQGDGNEQGSASGGAAEGRASGSTPQAQGFAKGFDSPRSRTTPPPAPAAGQAEFPECSGDPASCPENEGHGCCKRNDGSQWQPEARGVEGICKGTNCSASKENGHRHSSECLFDHARAVASGVESFSLGVTLNDDISYVDWRGQRIDLTAAYAAAQASVAGVFSQMSIGGDPVFPTTEKSP